MELRSLGRTGVKVSSLCLGCMMFGGRTNATDSYDIIDRALDAGINFLDTANVYSTGRSEEVTGEALKRNGKRTNVVLATKVHGKMGEGPNDMGNSRRHIIEQCEASLRRLRHGLHRPLPDPPSRSPRSRSMKRCARWTTSSARARCGTSARAPTAPGSSWNRSGFRRRTISTASFANSRLTTCSTGGSNAN